MNYDARYRKGMDKLMLAILEEGEEVVKKDGSCQLREDGSIVCRKPSAAMIAQIRGWMKDRNDPTTPTDDDGFADAIVAARKTRGTGGKLPTLSTDDDAASHA